MEKKIKSLKRKRNDTGAYAEHFSEGFITASESNALRSANAAVSGKELHLSRELVKSNFERKNLIRKVTCLEKEVEMVDIVRANCEIALSHLESAKKKVQQLELLSKNNTEKKYLRNQEALAKTEAALEKANMSKNSANEKICEMRLTIKKTKSCQD